MINKHLLFGVYFAGMAVGMHVGQGLHIWMQNEENSKWVDGYIIKAMKWTSGDRNP